ncbi:helix-turn-helix domain-containing protein [Shimazuella sp. AN120528]|uniref:helix-turn-helix domain-containing protein n=1 Tax=Shimazuella soli TaxID=1892854 RepID=UPI001F0F3060|nr:helix-turn-helix transcriptional regulator [Shimazuella soli]MCH5586285.1 helix-turn-helix domain-containing protein [Shimazuella soli]
MRDAKKFGAYIKFQRKKKDMTLTDLANKSGVDQSYLSRLERGEKENPSADILAKIADGLEEKRELIFYAAGYIDLDFDNLTIDQPVDIKQMLSDKESNAHWGNHPLTEEERKTLQRVIQAILAREE